MQQQIQIMFDLQDDMNSRVHSSWRTQGFAWYRAVWVECAEMLDHYGWKWWKQQLPDREQVKLELIDIWHFGLSMLLLEEVGAEVVGRTLAGQLKAEGGQPDFREELEAFVCEILQTRRFDVAGFARLMQAIDMSFEELYVGYVGKNVLNFFRQDHGYQDGSYRKEWGGKEDNEHLVELCATLDASAPNYKEQLYQALRERYELTA